MLSALCAGLRLSHNAGTPRSVSEGYTKIVSITLMPRLRLRLQLLRVGYHCNCHKLGLDISLGGLLAIMLLTQAAAVARDSKIWGSTDHVMSCTLIRGLAPWRD